MWDFSIGSALALMGRTLPFVLLRLAAHAGIALAFVVLAGTGAALGQLVGLFGDDAFRAETSAFGAFVGFALAAGALFFLQDHLLYRITAGHMAVMVALAEGRPVPAGKGQLAFGQAVVAGRYGTANALFGLVRLVRGVIGRVTGPADWHAGLQPFAGLDRVPGAARACQRLASGPMDAVILAQTLRAPAEDPWRAAETALVLYAQNAGAMLANAAWVMLAVWGLSLLVVLGMLGPAAAVVWLIPGTWAAGGLAFALLFAWAVKAAVIDPVALACLLQVYGQETEGQAADPACRARLAGASDRFRSLAERAQARAPAPLDPKRGVA